MAEQSTRHNFSRRGFLRTAAGMATAFVAMNEVYGPIYGVSSAEAANPELAQARTSDLAEIPERYGVTNVYGDLGQIFAQTTVAEPRLNAALMGILVRGLGHDHVVWGTDAVWTGSPQWQIESLRRLEIPEDMQRKHGFKPLGPADGPVKEAILGRNSAQMYKFEIKKAELRNDRFAAIKSAYVRRGSRPPYRHALYRDAGFARYKDEEVGPGPHPERVEG